jgi:hypothetical protein
MDPIMGSRANVLPPLTINASSTGYSAPPTPDDDEVTVIQEDDTDVEGSQRGKKKLRKSAGQANLSELTAVITQKWESDQEAERIMRAENQAARERHLELVERNVEASLSIAESFKIMAEKMK